MCLAFLAGGLGGIKMDFLIEDSCCRIISALNNSGIGPSKHWEAFSLMYVNFPPVSTLQILSLPISADIKFSGKSQAEILQGATQLYIDLDESTKKEATQRLELQLLYAITFTDSATSFIFSILAFRIVG